MKISIHQWPEVDIPEIAQLTYEVLQHSPATRRENRTPEGIAEWLCNLEFDEFFTGSPVIVLAHEEGRLIGWLMLCTTGGATAEVVPWGLQTRPIIAFDHDQITVGKLLVEKALTWARKEGVEVILLRRGKAPGGESDNDRA